jgi:hypothetical protein
MFSSIDVKDGRDLCQESRMIFRRPDDRDIAACGVLLHFRRVYCPPFPPNDAVLTLREPTWNVDRD